MHQENSAVSHLARIVESGRRAMGFTEHTAAGFETPHAVTRKPAVGSGSIDIRELYVTSPASLTAKVTTFNKTPVIPAQSKMVTIEAAIIESSRVAGLGASVIVAAERDTAYTAAGPAFYKDSGLFRIVEAANFGHVVDNDEASISSVPWFESPIEWADAPSTAFRVMIDRRTQKSIGGGSLLEDNLMEAIVLGLAQEADRTLLAAIVAANPAVFTLGAAATRGLSFGNLGAIAGSNGDAAQVDLQGHLRVLGIDAKFSKTVAQSIIGDFRKSAVAIYPTVQVHFERFSVEGNLACVVFANMQALLPDPTAFWRGV